MSAAGYHRTGAVLLIIALLVWFSMPLFRTTTSTPPPDLDFAWHRQEMKRERRRGNRETLIGAAAGGLAGVGFSLFVYGIALERPTKQQEGL